MIRKHFDRDWFTQQLAQHGWNQAQFGDKTKIDAGRISVLFKGSKPMLLSEAQRIAERLGLSTAVVLRHAGIEVEPPRMLSISAHVDGDGIVHQVAGDTEDEVESPRSDLTNKAYALQIRSRSQSYISAFDRWIVVVSGERQDPQALVGSIVLMALKDQQELLARIDKGYKAGTFQVQVPGAAAQALIVQWAMRVICMQPYPT